MQLITSIEDRWSAVRHKILIRSFSALAPFYLVNEFPKSGGTWLAQMLADALNVPFRRNAPIQIERSVTHGHFLNPVALRNVVIIWRDPRDVLVSLYYHCYFVNEHHNEPLVRLMKARCPFDDYSDIRANLPAFICFVSQKSMSPFFPWPEFVRAWTHRRGTVQTSYEALRVDAAGELARVVEALTDTVLPDGCAECVAERHSFTHAKQAADKTRPAGTELSFIREGSLGGWRKHFTTDAETAFRKNGYEEAIALLPVRVTKKNYTDTC